MKFVLCLLTVLSLRVQAQFDESSGDRAERPKTTVSQSDIDALAQARKTRSEANFIEAASKILGADATNLIALNGLGVFYFEQGKVGLAKLIFNRALAAHPNEAALHNNLGIVYLSEGRQRQALAAFRKSIELKRDYRIGAANLGSILVQYKDFEKALAPLEQGYKALRSELKSNPQAVEVANNYAVALAGAGRSSDAKKVYKEILDNNTRNSQVLFNYAVLLVDRLKEKSEASKIISRLKFVAEDPESIRAVERLEKSVSAMKD